MAHALGLHLFPPHLDGHHAAMDCSLLGLILPPGEFPCMFPAAACPPPPGTPGTRRKRTAGYSAARWHECSTAAAAATPAAAATAAPAAHARPAACAAGEKTVLKAQFDEDVIETLHITQVRPSPRLLALLRCPPSIGARMDGLPAAWGLNGPPRLWPLQVALGPKPKPGPHVVMVEKGGQKFAIGTLDAARCTQVGARPPTAARLACPVLMSTRIGLCGFLHRSRPQLPLGPANTCRALPLPPSPLSQFSCDFALAMDEVELSHTGGSEVHLTGYRVEQMMGGSEDEDGYGFGECCRSWRGWDDGLVQPLGATGLRQADEVHATAGCTYLLFQRLWTMPCSHASSW